MRQVKDSQIVREARESLEDPVAWVKEEWCSKTPAHYVKENVPKDEIQYQMCAEGAVLDAMGLIQWGEVGEGVEFEEQILKTNPQVQRIFKELQKSAVEVMPDVVQDFNTRRVCKGWSEEADAWLVDEKILQPGDTGYREADSIAVNEFNDHEVTKHEDVLAIFDKTAARLEELGR